MKSVVKLLIVFLIAALTITNEFQIIGKGNIQVSAANGNSNSEAFVVMDSNTGKIINKKNATKIMYPASLTKIATAIFTIESLHLDEQVIVSNKAVRAIGTRVYLLEDEEISVEQLLHGLMVSSGNDAAIALAEHISGSVEKFADEINQFLIKKIGVTNTHFTNPHGLFDEDHKTTAIDLAKVSAYAMKNETFRALVSTESYDWIGEGWETTLYNHHPLTRRYEEIIGIKNGYVRKSGYTLATASVQGNTELIVITLNSDSREFAMQDTLHLLKDSFDRFETQWISFNNERALMDFIYPETVPVTTSISEPIKFSVSNSGYLTIRGQGNRFIDFVVLKERKPIELPKFSYMIDVGKDEITSNQSTSEIKKFERSIIDWFVLTGFHFYLLK